MKKFRFRLEGVRNYRQALEENLKLQLAAAYREREQEEIRLEAYRKEREKFFRQIPLSGNLDLGTLQHHFIYLETLEQQIEEQMQEVERAERRVQDAGRRVRDAVQQRKILDRLRERQKEEYDYELARQEQGDLDEAGLTSYWKKARKGGE
ncbi:flagellar export protein FliJ [Calderihabitans maritimus]|uniref:Flagellar FliJ protein n=1 Tax=Calderihabitans maritimus TaxID=1246530 RepID=A0A1Z5HUF8_9FIRM|nr:flagellar export protein FliJ [Calderihabitans maritimus]GAW92920.1 flagellar biosynthesis chaperone [Calderihabitans maritimus]